MNLGLQPDIYSCMNSNDNYVGEIWKPIDGSEGRYEVSNYGRVKSYARDKENGVIKAEVVEKGYHLVSLTFPGLKQRRYMVHRLVAQAFIPNPLNLPQVNHKDENKGNNIVSNLEWCDNRYNSNYGTRNERVSMGNRQFEGRNQKVYSVDNNGIVERFISIKDAARRTGLTSWGITEALKGIKSRYGEREWRYETA